MSSSPGAELGERIRQIRDRVPRHEFARNLEIGTSTLQRYESGERRPDAELLRRLCRRYKVSPAWLLLGTGPIRLDEESRASSSRYPHGTSSGFGMKEAAEQLLIASREVGFEPPAVWSTLIQELMVAHGLNAAGARRLIETLAALQPGSAGPRE